MQEKSKIVKQELADLSGVGLNTVVALETGHRNPSLKTLEAILDTLGLELSVQERTPPTIPLD